MHITLDYYRILSVPIKADLAQIERAYKDRVQQQARREYSESAIAARQQILKQAYTVLSNPETKAQYDKSFFAEIENNSHSASNSATETESTIVLPKQPVTVNPYIEIEPELLPGALMILYELAEYEMILHLGTDYLNQQLEIESASNYPISQSNSNTATLDKADPKPDILLCLALSYLELSREQWQCKEWEQAAISGQMGLNLLQQERSLFPSLQAEIQADLDLLKPYRILDLLSSDRDDSAFRSKGIELLKEMLLQRKGIEGNRNAPSGLKQDQFLCFIQQIRTYLTLQEQKEIFLAEAKRGSAPGSCVAAYTLVAEGYSQKKPESIVKAKQIFQELSPSQDTHWERAVCALLLGKTAESQAIIQQNKETPTYELISKRSQYSPDLIPGIYFYAEQWLNSEVLSQFNSLNSSDISLHQYFDDSVVQAYLEKISPVKVDDQKNSVNASSPKTVKQKSKFPWWGKNSHSTFNTANKTQVSTNSSANVAKVEAKNNRKSVAVSSNANTYSANPYSYNKTNSPVNNKINSHKGIKLPNTEQFRSYNEPQLQIKTQSTPTAYVAETYHGEPHTSSSEITKTQPKRNKAAKRKKPASQKSSGRNWLLLLGIIFGVGAFGFIITKNILDSGSNNPVVVESPPDESLQTPTNSETDYNADSETAEVNNIPETEVIPQQPVIDTLNTELARETIQKWLDSKKAALGKQYQIETLNSILVAPALTQWRNTASYYQQNNIYRQFDHTLEINSVKIDPDNSDLATVDAAISETAQHYQQGKLNQTQSYDSNLVVRYQLVRQNDNWLIKSSKLLQNQ